jgi:hypothetical protein
MRGTRDAHLVLSPPSIAAVGGRARNLCVFPRVLLPWSLPLGDIGLACILCSRPTGVAGDGTRGYSVFCLNVPSRDDTPVNDDDVGDSGFISLNVPSREDDKDSEVRGSWPNSGFSLNVPSREPPET